jgi:dihydropteroate synthase
VSESEEIDRMSRAVEAVRDVTVAPISANTKYSNVARAARAAGATILNDVSGLAHDVLLPEVAKTYDGIVLTASADYANVLNDPVTVVRQTLRDSLQRAQRAGIPMDKLVLDPGIGFFRNKDITWEEWDHEILRNLGELRDFHVPIAVGLSRKSFIGKVLGYEDPADRLYGSLGLTSLAVMRGAHIIRTHDVAATRDVIRITQWFAGDGYI